MHVLNGVKVQSQHMYTVQYVYWAGRGQVRGKFQVASRADNIRYNCVCEALTRRGSGQYMRFTRFSAVKVESVS